MAISGSQASPVHAFLGSIRRLSVSKPLESYAREAMLQLITSVLRLLSGYTLPNQPVSL